MATADEVRASSPDSASWSGSNDLDATLAGDATLSTGGSAGRREDGGTMTADDWHDPGRHCLGVLLAEPLDEDEDTLMIVINLGTAGVRFSLPDGAAFSGWHCLLATVEKPVGPLRVLDASPESVYVLAPTR